VVVDGVVAVLDKREGGNTTNESGVVLVVPTGEVECDRKPIEPRSSSPL
jgi:hypothetical protein